MYIPVAHRLDHILYEWRKLRDTDIILGDLEYHIVLQSENFTTDANTLNTTIPVKETWLLATCRNVTYHSNPTELDALYDALQNAGRYFDFAVLQYTN